MALNNRDRAIRQGTAQATTSGTAIDFTGIPAWAKRITVMLSGVSTNGVSTPQIQIGSGSVDTTGYLSMGMALTASNSGSAATTGFVIRSGNATATLFGHIVLTLISGNIWVASGNVEDNINGAVALLAGNKSLAGALDRIRLTTANGTDTFDTGSVNITWEE